MNRARPSHPWLSLMLVVTTLLALANSGCSSYAEVSEKEPAFRPLRSTLGQLANVEKSINGGIESSSRNPRAAIGDLLVAARDAAKHLEDAPGDTAARDAYNFAISRVFSIIKSSKLDPWSHPFVVPSPRGDITLTHRPDPRPGWNPALYDFTPADRFDLSGSYVKNRTKRAGIGAPLVATGRGMNDRMKEDFTIPRIYYGVTAVVRFEGQRAVVDFEDPLATEEIRFAGRTHPLAADFTVPLAVMLASTEPRKLEIMRLLNPGEYAHTARIARLQPYDPDKTVVLVIHGLMDSQATWTPMINTLRGDPEIRKNYQFWFYSYPSGYPYPHSAALLRQELDAITKRYPLKHKMVVIGHSMGGCISRLLITDSGDKLWTAFVTQVVEKPEWLQDPRFARNPLRVKNADALQELIEEIFTTQPTAHWVEKLDAAGVPGGPVYTFDQTMVDPQVQHRRMVHDIEHPVIGPMKTLGLPVKSNGELTEIRKPAPLHGQHTEEVLRTLGYSDNQVRGLIAEGVVRAYGREVAA